MMIRRSTLLISLRETLGQLPGPEVRTYDITKGFITFQTRAYSGCQKVINQSIKRHSKSNAKVTKKLCANEILCHARNQP